MKFLTKRKRCVHKIGCKNSITVHRFVQNVRGVGQMVFHFGEWQFHLTNHRFSFFTGQASVGEIQWYNSNLYEQLFVKTGVAFVDEIRILPKLKIFGRTVMVENSFEKHKKGGWWWYFCSLRVTSMTKISFNFHSVCYFVTMSWKSCLVHHTQALVLSTAECGFNTRPGHLVP